MTKLRFVFGSHNIQFWNKILCLGLFHKVIIQSGHALSPWAFRENQVDIGFEIGRKLGFEGNDREELANFLRKQPAEVLHNESWNAMRKFKKVKAAYFMLQLYNVSIKNEG